MENAGEVHYYAKLQNAMGWLHNLVGDYETALHWDQQALETSRRTDVGGLVEAECYSLLNIATDELCLNHIAHAEQRLAEFEALLPRAEYSRPRYFNRYLIFLAELALANDEPEAALTRAHEACDFAETHSFRKNMARGKLLAGQALLLSDKPGAAELLSQAQKIADEIAHPALGWQTRLYLSQALAASDKNAASLVEEANQQLQAILTGIDDLHWKACLKATKPIQQLRAASSIAENRTEKELPANLTSREIEVLRWIADGATNQMIASQLYISVKTVNTHVQSILRKTRSDNRAAAAAFAVRHGFIAPKS
jgi:DNA-binding CsgD family transcriptional regulator